MAYNKATSKKGARAMMNGAMLKQAIYSLNETMRGMGREFDSDKIARIV